VFEKPHDWILLVVIDRGRATPDIVMMKLKKCEFFWKKDCGRSSRMAAGTGHAEVVTVALHQ
jgi:hypothetical protein